MTLVVARKIGGSILLVADTKLSADEMTSTPVPITAGVVKLKIISDDQIIAFAGNEYVAEQALRALSPARSVERTL